MVINSFKMSVINLVYINITQFYANTMFSSKLEEWHLNLVSG